MIAYVHAEAISIVSIFLRGHIMKLGLLGVHCCTSSIPVDSFYGIFVSCVISIHLAITSCRELDRRRWLVFLSLTHSVVWVMG